MAGLTVPAQGKLPTPTRVEICALPGGWCAWFFVGDLQYTGFAIDDKPMEPRLCAALLKALESKS